MITVMGATGHTGGAIARRLLDAGEEVRALGRSETKLDELRRAGAETVAGDMTDPAFLAKAFTGADAVYTLLPFDPTVTNLEVSQRLVGEATVQAVRAAGVRYLVALSSVGADLPRSPVFIANLRDQERRLRGLVGANVLILRSVSFFEGFYAVLDVVKQHGVNGDVVAPHVQRPMIAVRDLAEVAANALISRDWDDVVVRELLGERDLSYAEVTRIIGERIGRPDLPYVQLPDADMIESLGQAGFSAGVADDYVAFSRAFSEGNLTDHVVRTPQNTTPTRFEDFAIDWAIAYAAR
ncbi:MAG TPA: NAD(P)H-binding protein [Nakamurella sp.]